MCNKKIILLCVGMLMFGIVNVVLMRDTQAETCYDVEGKNDSLEEACDCGGSDCGAMWISDKSGVENIDSTINVSESEWNKGKKDVYLHGAILYGGDAKATYVWISEGKDKIETYDAYFNAKKFEGFDDDALSFLYKYGMWREGNPYPYVNPITSSVKKLTLDLGILRNKYGISGKYDIDLQIFRCYDAGYEDEEGRPLFYPMHYTPSNCYSNTSKLNINVPSVNESVSYQGSVRALGTKDLNVSWGAWVRDRTAGWFATTNWSGNDDFVQNVEYTIEDCDPSTGCYAQFRHRLWASKFPAYGIYNLNRKITRADGTVRAECKNVKSISQDGDGNMVCGYDPRHSTWFWYPEDPPGRPIKTDADWDMDKSYVKIYPGEKVCDTITFSVKSDTMTTGYSNYGNDSATVCVTAEAKAPLGGMTIAMNTDNTKIDLDKWWTEVDVDDDKWWEATKEFNWTRVGDKSEEVSKDINCSVVDGCFVQFRHYLQNQKGSGSSAYYKIERSTNSGVSCTLNNDNPCNGVVKDHSEIVFEKNTGTGLQSDVVKIYPGQTVCETLYFKENESDSYNTYTKACVTALGSASSTIDIQVKNDTLNTGYEKSVYAKPNDYIRYKVAYTPTLQYAKDLIVDNVTMGQAGQAVQILGNSERKNLQTLFGQLTNMKYGDSYKDKLLWNNAFWLGGFHYNDPYKYTDGDREMQEEELPSKIVHDTSSRVYVQNATINPVNEKGAIVHYGEDNDGKNNVWATPTSIVFIKYRGLSASLQANTVNDSVSVFVPYNFKNEIEIKKPEELKLYAGETASELAYDVSVHTRYNNVTYGTYATRVENPKIRVCIYEEGKELNDSTDCVVKEYNDTVWNKGGSTEDKTVEIVGDRPLGVVPDVPAGTSVCVRVGVYPKSSGSDDNYRDSEGDHEWEQDTKCVPVRKKPSFQVWGGNISAQEINAKFAKKQEIYDSSSLEGRIFGSWGELAVASGINDAIGSGASLGYAKNMGGQLSPRQTPPPPSNELGMIGNNPRVGASNSNPGGGGLNIETNPTNPLWLGEGEGVNTEDIKNTLYNNGYTKVAYDGVGGVLSGDDAFNPIGDEQPKRIIYESSEDIEISGDIIVGKRGGDEDGYTSLRDVPSFVIFTEKNIGIKCDVTRIDAILIAKGAINTCSDINGESLKSSSGASKQLTINGALYAKTINFNRTYGAATGNNSIVPAEIINYDNSLLISGATSRTSEGELNVEATFELAPRF